MLLKYQLKRSTCILLAAVLVVATALPLLIRQKAHAYGLPTSRSVQMSSSKQADTAVTYTVTFTTATAGTIKSMVFDFCQNSPIINDTCTAPSGFSVGTPTVSGFFINAVSQAAGWTFASANTNRTLTFTNATGVAVLANQVITFNLTTATNPNNTNTTFYSRILTYPNSAGADSAATYPATGSGGGPGVGNAFDAGGVAMSTTNQINITSKVQERLTFCVYTGATCAAGGNAVNLGDTNGVLDPAGPYVDKTTTYDVSTNATGGATLRLKGDTLKNGAFSINAAGASAVASSAGTEQFGLCNYQSSGSGLTTVSPYNNASCSTTSQSAGTGTTGGVGSAQFAFDTNASTGTLSTYGQSFATKAAGTTSTGKIAFLGNISSTTQAGIYTTTLTFIATGVY